MRRRSSERPYHRPQARRLQRDVQLTGPLAVGELGGALEAGDGGGGGGGGRGGDGSSRWQEGRSSMKSLSWVCLVQVVHDDAS